MTANDYTPGPLKLVRQPKTEDMLYFGLEDGDGYVVAADMVKADALLFQQAPTLLELCETIVQEGLVISPRTLHRLRTVTAKARGL